MAPESNGTALLNALREGTALTASDDLARFSVLCADTPRVADLTAENYADDLLATLSISRFATGLVFADVGDSGANDRAS
jgi:hypothetical protein